MKEFITRRKKWLILLAILAGILVISVPLIDQVSLAYFREGDFQQDTVKRTEKEIEQLFGMMVNHLHVTQDHIRRDQRFVDLLNGFAVNPAAYQQLHLIPRQTFDFRKIAVNKKYTLIAERDSVRTLRALIYESSPIDYFIFHFGDSVWVEAGHRTVEIREREVAGVIGSTLAETIGVIGISPELTNRFVDIFAWQIDFQRLQRGDRFKLFYEEQVVEGQIIGIGRILGVFFEHARQPYYAIPFEQGEGLDFYDYEGNSLRKALLKYPIEFTRISSRFNPRRFHPIAQVFRAHKGTDFAAPAGTPIRSVGDGVVLEARYNGNNGNYVKIRHNSTYSTQYLHMSKIASGLHPGDRVTQGETIGFVGSTGLATGPHLCYRFWKNGVQVDALRVELPPSQPVKADYFTQFEAVRLQVIRRLDKIILPEPPLAVIQN
ncbi:MAG: peptidoglycan DD-metalloendopeptidase family protein [Cyclobacteriaceae bacterium]|nr:peptidoglycan DD-metalloendopeptidase family protein [Cyclobacteriaceae bacterium]